MSMSPQERIEKLERQFKANDAISKLKGKLFPTPGPHTRKVKPTDFSTLVEKAATFLTEPGSMTPKQQFMSWLQALRAATGGIAYQTEGLSDEQDQERIALQIMGYALLTGVPRHRLYRVLSELARQGSIELWHQADVRYSLTIESIIGVMRAIVSRKNQSSPQSVAEARYPKRPPLTAADWVAQECLSTWEKVGAARKAAVATKDERLGRKTVEGMIDPYGQGDLPALLFGTLVTVDGTPAEIRCLRTSAPLFQESAQMQRGINAEFRAFLELASGFHHPHLYINQWADEPVGTPLLQQLGRIYERSFQIMTLPRSSLFYAQTDHFSDLKDATLFKQNFLLFLQKSEEGFYLPPTLSNGTKDAQLLFDLIHQGLFAKQKSFSVTERQQFIDIAYLMLTAYALLTLRPASFSISGRPTLDNSHLSNALFYLYLAIVADQETLPETTYDWEAITFGPVLEAPSTSLLTQDIERFQGTAQRLLSQATTLKKLLPTWQKASSNPTFKSATFTGSQLLGR